MFGDEVQLVVKSFRERFFMLGKVRSFNLVNDYAYYVHIFCMVKSLYVSHLKSPCVACLLAQLLLILLHKPTFKQRPRCQATSVTYNSAAAACCLVEHWDTGCKPWTYWGFPTMGIPQ